MTPLISYGGIELFLRSNNDFYVFEEVAALSSFDDLSLFPFGSDLFAITPMIGYNFG